MRMAYGHVEITLQNLTESCNRKSYKCNAVTCFSQVVNHRRKMAREDH
jgi:hypothetical protein